MARWRASRGHFLSSLGLGIYVYHYPNGSEL